MTGLTAKDGFVGSGKGKDQKHKSSRIFLVSIVVVLLLSSAILMVFFFPTPSDNMKGNGENGYRTVEQDFGLGGYSPQVVDAGDYFIVATAHDGTITIRLINGTTGEIEKTSSPAIGVSYFRIAVDEINEVLLVTWINATYLNGTFMYQDTTGEIVKTSNFTIAMGVGNTGFGLAYGNGKFLVVWSNTGYDNYGKFISYNPSDPDNPTLGTEFLVSPDTDHSHAKNFVAYDNTTKHFLVLWRNNTASKVYGVTARIFDSDGNSITGDIMIADGYTKYFYPSGEGGHGKFFIAYTNPSSPYDVYGIYMDASTGSIERTITIDQSYKYASSSTVGIVYNGTHFVVVYANVSEDIVSQAYDLDGNPSFSTPRKISTLDDENQWPDVAYDSDGKYYFVWYDYNTKHDYGSLWTEEEYIPEFSALLPILAIFLVGIVIWRRKH